MAVPGRGLGGLLVLLAIEEALEVLRELVIAFGRLLVPEDDLERALDDEGGWWHFVELAVELKLTAVHVVGAQGAAAVAGVLDDGGADVDAVDANGWRAQELVLLRELLGGNLDALHLELVACHVHDRR